MDDFLQGGDCSDANPRFAAWRRRQISRARSELGETAQSIKHPVIAFELSAGCSVGCWFCGVGAGKFQESYPYTPETSRLWRDLLAECTRIFGSAAQTGFCYWATEPTDNPDYPRFIEDFRDVTGAIPPTTTAMPLRDLAMTRRILDLHVRYGGLPNRFSILTLRTLDQVHATFSALELLGVELVLQNAGALQDKSCVGRARDKAALVEKHNRKPVTDDATIACVSGFLVNMVGGSIRLISPVTPSERWPLGYRVYGERRFKSAPEFRRAMDDLIVEHMPMTIAASARLALRGDLAFERDGDRFILGSRGARYALGGFAGAGLLGEMLKEGHSTLDGIHAALEQFDADPLVVGDAVQRLFDKGLIEAGQEHLD
jgi:radical SAM family RiPP maturation amino acid epimerase